MGGRETGPLQQEPVMTVHLKSILSENEPRYTSYPAAPHFHAGIGPRQTRTWLSQSPSSDTISLYVHVPFCDKLCWFCACHTKHTRGYKTLTISSCRRPSGRLSVPYRRAVRAIPRGGRDSAICSRVNALEVLPAPERSDPCSGRHQIGR